MSFWDTVLDVDFRAGHHHFYKVTGWSEPDWTVGERFTIDFGRLPRRNRLIIRLTALSFLAQQFEVLCNDVVVGAYSAVRPFVASFPVPPSAITPEGTLRLTLTLFEPKRPCDHVGTTDTRELGLSIARVEILGTCLKDHEAWPDLPAADALIHDAAALALFESLGDNCELGFVQKRVGVLESSLLRFCATPVGSLLDGLAHGFTGIDVVGDVSIVVGGPDGAREYQVVLRRYGLHYHTLTFTHEAGEEEVLDRELAKLRYKHAKFLDGLSKRDRIYVLKQNDDLLLPTVWTVWLALQRYGPNSLLWMRTARAEDTPGQVQVLAPGLLEGIIASFADYNDATQGDDGAWIALCRDALALVSTAANRFP